MSFCWLDVGRLACLKWRIVSEYLIICDYICLCVPIYKPYNQGRTEKLKRGEGRILRKIFSFCEILNKMFKNGGGGKDRRPPPTCTPMLIIKVCKEKTSCL